MPPISVMLKPSSAICNMKCLYCFYHSLASQRENFSQGFMNEEILEETIKKIFSYSDGSRVYLSFQGGEPLLAGIEFFEKAIKYIKKYNTKRSEIEIVIQTNGLLLNEDWCIFLKKNDILIGLSLDGNEIHNSYRLDVNGQPTFKQVFKNAKLLQKHSVPFNILTVITPKIAENIKEIYLFFKENNFKFLQFIPCLKPLGSSYSSFCLSSKQYGDFLLTLFSLYMADIMNNNYTSIRLFDNFALLAKGLSANQCGMNGHCTHQYVVEGDGSVYPCDFYCIDEYKLGNIRNDDFFNLSINQTAKDFIFESLLLQEKCKKCSYYSLCRGGCKRESLDLEKCEAYLRFFPIALPYLVNLI
ncbi:MAG: anaerobic sulfatase maturase [Clostridia bacterium]|nr:anaerobic sulfatase maturase [Clostridia bacterium]